MSDIAVLSGVTEYIHDRLPDDWNTDNCKAMPDGQPDPMMGDRFASVFIREVQSRLNTDDGYHEEIWGVSITITERLKAVPYDRISPSIYLTNLTGIAAVAERTLYAIQNRWSVIQWLNSRLELNDLVLNTFVDHQIFMHPLVLLNRSPKLEFREEEWFHGTHGVSPPRDTRDGLTGVSLTLNFGNLLKQTVLADDICPPEEG